jgi:hypothetical protein
MKFCFGTKFALKKEDSFIKVKLKQILFMLKIFEENEFKHVFQIDDR